MPNRARAIDPGLENGRANRESAREAPQFERAAERADRGSIVPPGTTHDGFVGFWPIYRLDGHVVALSTCAWARLETWESIAVGKTITGFYLKVS